MPETAPQKVTLQGENVAYEVRQSDEATQPRIDVDIHGVRVVLPQKSTTDPDELLKENAAWVLEKKRKYDAYREQIPQREFEEGERFPYLGEQYEIVVEKRPASQVSDNEFLLARHHVEQASIKRALETLYRRKAR